LNLITEKEIPDAKSFSECGDEEKYYLLQ